MSSCQVVEADSPTLKRSFDAVRGPDTYQHLNNSRENNGGPDCVRTTELSCHCTCRPLKKRSISISPTSAMPIQTTAPVAAAFPSFMSVFGGGMGNIQDEMSEDTLPREIQGGTQYNTGKSFQTHYPLPTAYQHQHRESTASIHSDSTDSSPTTTISTFDSPSITDPSPSSSPESPSSLLPLSSFQKMMDSPKKKDAPYQSSQPTTFFPAQPRSESPASKERNVKNLSLNMNVSAARPVSSSAADGIHAFSAPTSPLRGPLKTGRRKPNNLTIQTPSFEKTTFAAAAEVPPTPSNRPSLKHHESSPALPSLMSPTTAPPTGMQLPPISMSRLLSRPGSESSFSSLSVSSQGLQDVKEETDVNEALKSQEAQERGYPDGPIRIYDSGVYLYLEPSREEASKFDTIINVAKEVNNPFSKPSFDAKSSVMSVWRSSERQDSPEPQTAVSDVSFKSAFEWPQTNQATSPTTPKARLAEPEYIHVPWDHNSEILNDLYALCQIIDSRIAARKSVLIHCQLGVSRSASLVIAYGLYKGLKADFHSMYTSVKERSQWVGPNMSLIYQLMDFRAKCASGEYDVVSKPASQDWFLRPNPESEMTPRPRSVPLDVSTAPLPPSKSTQSLPLSTPDSGSNLSSVGQPAPLAGEDQNATRKISLPTALSNIALTSPSSESATTTSPTSPSQDAPPVPPRSAKRSAPRPLPLRERTHVSNPFEIPPHTPRDVSNGAQMVSYAPFKMDLVMHDVPPTPSIFSPRVAEFKATPFGITNAGDLATEKSLKKPGQGKRTSIFSPPTAHLAIDPRSPHQGNENGEIMRHIDDVL
jgi:tyrosine-protein phosphatase MSG5